MAFENEVEFSALVVLIENNWEEFVDLSGGEKNAKRNLDGCRERSDFSDNETVLLAR